MQSTSKRKSEHAEQVTKTRRPSTSTSKEEQQRGLSGEATHDQKAPQNYNLHTIFTPPEFSPIQLTFLLRRSTELTSEALELCFKLIESTSRMTYKNSSRGWHPQEKREEMADPDMWYLIVQEKDTDAQRSRSSADVNLNLFVGFLSFKLDYDDPPNDWRSVGYIYEIHLHEKARGHGLGSLMVTQAEKLVHSTGIGKTMLTVFTSNIGARRCYERLGYSKDEASPEDRVTRRGIIQADYMILSKLSELHNETKQVHG